MLSLREKRLSSTMLKHLVLISLLYPVYTSNVESAFGPDVVVANLFALLFVGAAILESNLDGKQKNWLAWAIGLCMVGFNAFAFYTNWAFHNWYAGQVNVSISFALFGALLLSKDSAEYNSEGFVKFLLAATVITNLIGFIPRLMGYDGSIFSDGIMYFYVEPLLEESRYSWVYLHKSEYAFMMVLFLALAITYRQLFARKWMFYGSVGVFVVALVLSNTRTTMLAAMFILAGCVVDYLLKKIGGFSWKILLWLVSVAAVGVGMLLVFARDKTLWTLGDRVFIWWAAVRNVLDNPWGTGAMTGQQIVYDYFPKYDFGVGIRNCHNVFLNILLQFSIPAGFFYLLSLFAIGVGSLCRRVSFQTLGIWAAIFMAMMMDWCVLLPQLSMMLLMFYFIFFGPKTEKNQQGEQA